MCDCLVFWMRNNEMPIAVEGTLDLYRKHYLHPRQAMKARKKERKALRRISDTKKS